VRVLAARRVLRALARVEATTRAPSIAVGRVERGAAVAFEAQPAQIGAVAPAVPPSPGCPPGADPADDSCPAD
jgi:hypothetical protein